jgi:antitoxin ParD1/3/4
MDINVSLSDELLRFVQSKIASGRYASSSDVVREALHLLEEQDARRAGETLRLRQAWEEGVASGDFQPLDLDAVKAEGRMRAVQQPR